MRLGIDFGTTNSAVAATDVSGTPRILELFPGERIQRTVLYGSPRGEIFFGNEGFRKYVESDLEGRLLRSLKSFLSQDVPKTVLAGRSRSFTDLITLYLRFLLREAERVTGETVTDVVLGRPVHFNVDRSRDGVALERLREAAQQAGIPSIRFRLEPVAAAYAYERALTSEKCVLIGDFGGGTADFAVLRVGPERARRTDRTDDILATSGVALAGDALDGRFLDAFLLDAFGRGAHYHEPYKTEWLPWKHRIQSQIQRLYYIHLLRSDDLRRRLEAVQPRMDDQRVIRRLIRLVFDDLGYPLAWAIESTKKQLSSSPTARFRFNEFYSDTLNLDVDVDLARFADASSGMLTAYGEAVDEVLASAGLTDDDIGDVFLTGGTSQTPFVRRVFEDRFGAGRVQEGDSMTSVCLGLARA